MPLSVVAGIYTKYVQTPTRVMSQREEVMPPYCDSCEALSVISAHYRWLQIPEHSTSETTCMLFVMIDNVYDCFLLSPSLSYYPVCST